MFRNLSLLVVALLLAGFSDASFEEASSPLLTTVFPKSPVKGHKGDLSLSHTYTDSGSKWAKGADEKDSFHASLKHEQGADYSWEVRISKGGPIYSLRGPFGESMPPQEHDGGKWIDEVTQLVAVDHAGMNRDAIGAPLPELQYYIHQAGDYQRAELKDKGSFFFSPMLAESYDRKERSYSVVNWGQQAHIPNIHKSGVLYYQKVRDAGDGVIEVTYIIHNFGQDTIDWLDIPWGSVRTSALPKTLLGNADGSYADVTRVLFQAASKEPFKQTFLKDIGGWIAYTQSGADHPSSYTLSFVVGRDKHWDEQKALQDAGKAHFEQKPAFVGWGDTGWLPRDYTLCDVTHWSYVRPGDNYFCRYYMVVGPENKVIEKSRKLADMVDYGILTFSEKDSEIVDLKDAIAGVSGLGNKGKENEGGLYTEPVEGAKPLFLLRETATDRLFVSCDPYEFCSTQTLKNPYPKDHEKFARFENQAQYKPYDGRTQYLALLGYAMPKEMATAAEKYADIEECVKGAIAVSPSAKGLVLRVRK